VAILQCIQCCHVIVTQPPAQQPLRAIMLDSLRSHRLGDHCAALLQRRNTLATQQHLHTSNNVAQQCMQIMTRIFGRTLGTHNDL
jgi:hypothetical protein